MPSYQLSQSFDVNFVFLVRVITKVTAVSIILGMFGPYLGERPGHMEPHPHIAFNVGFRTFDNDLDPIRFLLFICQRLVDGPKTRQSGFFTVKKQSAPNS